MTENENSSNKFSLIFLTLILVGVSFLAGTLFSNLNKEKAAQNTQSGSQPTAAMNPTAAPSGPKTLGVSVGRFTILDQEVCLNEQGKPLVYYFGSSGCPHCKWEYPVVKEVMAKFASVIDFRDRMDSQEDMNIFQEYQSLNNGSIPFLLFGCRYARVGSGENDGEAVEAKNLTALLCKLTDGQPASACAGVADLTKTIN